MAQETNNSNNNQNKKPSIVYSFIYGKIAASARGNLIRTKLLRQTIIRNIICAPQDGSIKGGSMKGLPKVYLYDIIQDMIDEGFITRIDHTKYRINKDRKFTKRLRMSFPF